MAQVKMSEEAFNEYKRKEAAEIAARKANGSPGQTVKTHYTTNDGAAARHLERQEANRKLRDEAGVTPSSGGKQKVKTYYDAPKDETRGLIPTAKKIGKTVGRKAIAIGKDTLKTIDKKSAGFLEDSEKADKKVKSVYKQIDNNFKSAGVPGKGSWTDPEADFKHKGYGEYRSAFTHQFGEEVGTASTKSHEGTEDDFADMGNKKGRKKNKKEGKKEIFSQENDHSQYKSVSVPKSSNQRIATHTTTLPFGGSLPTIGNFGGGPLPRIGGPQNVSRSPLPKIHSPGGSRKSSPGIMNDLPRISMFETNIGGGFGLNNNLPPKKKSGNLMKDIKSLNVKSSGY